MKTCLIQATIVAAAVAICLSPSQTQAQGQRPSGTSVAVIDLGLVFKEHPRLQQQLESIKTEIETFEAYVRQEKKRVEAMAEELKTLRPGSDDYTAKEKALAALQADLQVQVRQKSRDFLEHEAQIRYEAYQDIQQQVAAFCQQYGIQLVIRFSSQDIDGSKPQEVQIGLNRPIVYQYSLDITGHIVSALKQPNASNVGRRNASPAIPGRTQR